MKVLLALIYLPFLVIYNSVKGAVIITSQGIFVATLLWIFLSPVMIVLSIIVGIGLTKNQIIENRNQFNSNN